MYPMKYYLNDDYSPFEIFGVKGLFTNMRVERDSLPDGFYKYSIRGCEDNDFVSLSKAVWVDHTGDFICKTPIMSVEAGNEVDINGDFSFLDSEIRPEEFFGVSFKEKLAEAIDAFCFDHDFYEYIDNAPSPVENPREAMLAHIFSQLGEKDGVDAIRKHIQEIRDESIDENTNGKEYAYATDLIVELDSWSREFDMEPSLDEDHDVDSFEPRVSIAATLPDGWEWRDYNDGSGSLKSPEGKSYFSYDLLPYAAIGEIEYQRDASCVSNRYTNFYGSLSDFKVFAESEINKELTKSRESLSDKIAAAKQRVSSNNEMTVSKEKDIPEM
ncbi:MAG: hypothetical protein IJZ42_13430 [Lachnospiraceae bacterium]|nr:hypothetical protein [Lachnospiraceae bacterium]